MITYLDVSDYSLLLAFLAKEYNQTVLSVLQGEELKLKRLKIISFSDLEQEISTSGDLFDFVEAQDLLVDIQDLQIDATAISHIQNLVVSANTHIWLYSLTNPVFTAELNKLWVKAGFGYELLKSTDEILKQQIAKEYLQNTILKPDEVYQIIKQASNYTELIDNLDFISLSDNQHEAIKSLLKHEETPLFMLGFDPDKFERQLPIWYKQTKDDDVQLALSLIFTKLEKQNTTIPKKILKILIQTDQSIKTGSKLNQLTRWKLFLFKAQSAYPLQKSKSKYR